VTVKPADAPGPPLVVLIDFDGTIARSDVSDEVMRRFATPEDWAPLETAYLSGEIGSRTLLTRQAGLLHGETTRIAAIGDHEELDPHFIPLLCADRGWPHRPWDSFAGIGDVLAELIETCAPAPRARQFICGPEVWPRGTREPIWDRPPAPRSKDPGDGSLRRISTWTSTRRSGHEREPLDQATCPRRHRPSGPAC